MGSWVPWTRSRHALFRAPPHRGRLQVVCASKYSPPALRRRRLPRPPWRRRRGDCLGERALQLEQVAADLGPVLDQVGHTAPGDVDHLLDTAAPPGTITEAFAVMVMGIVAGTALGNALGGAIVEGWSYEAGALVAMGAAVAGTAIAFPVLRNPEVLHHEERVLGRLGALHQGRCGDAVGGVPGERRVLLAVDPHVGVVTRRCRRRVVHHGGAVDGIVEEREITEELVFDGEQRASPCREMATALEAERLAVRMIHEANSVRTNADGLKVGGHQASSASLVSVMTALLPKMSAAAAEGRYADVSADLNRGIRLTITALAPIAVAYGVLGVPIAVTLFQGGAFTYADAFATGRPVSSEIAVWNSNITWSPPCEISG